MRLSRRCSFVVARSLFALFSSHPFAFFQSRSHRRAQDACNENALAPFSLLASLAVRWCKLRDVQEIDKQALVLLSEA
jgi:hypothetical protein